MADLYEIVNNNCIKYNQKYLEKKRLEYLLKHTDSMELKEKYLQIKFELLGLMEMMANE